MVEAWSKSSLNSLLDGCSWQWALKKIYSLEDHGSPATAMGTGYHKAMEEWEGSGRSLTLRETQDVAAEAAFEECKKLPMSQWFEHSTDPEQVIELAREAVRLWWEKAPNKGSTLREIAEARGHVGSEIYYKELAENGIMVHGFVDTIYEDDRHVTVVDHKTASSMRRWGYKKEPNIEVAVYLAMATRAQQRGELPDKPIHFEYHVVAPKEGKTRIIDMGYLKGEHLELLNTALYEANALVKYNAYRPNPEWNLCSPKYCAYFQGCRVDGTLSPYNLTISNVPEPNLSAANGMSVEAQ
jgi:hypothetical protein